MIKIETAAYTRTNGHIPHQTSDQNRRMWAFTIDGQKQVNVKYGTYAEALAWAQAQAWARVELLP